MNTPNVSLCADIDTLEATEVVLDPNGDGFAIMSVHFPGVSIQSYHMPAGWFAAHLRRLADDADRLVAAQARQAEVVA